MTAGRSATARAVDWAFRDRTTGRIVVGQWPNAPLWLFAASSAAAWALDIWWPQAQPGWRLAVSAIARVSLAWWALDEIIRGVNPWRRCLGAAMLVALAWSLAAGF